jgi:RecA/RadA recombinase
MNKLAEKLKKSSTIKETAMLRKSKIYNDKDMIQTPIPMMNVALSGSVDGGLTPGVTVLAGPSKHFKSAFALIMAAAYQAKYPDSIVLFYDTEFGTPQSYYTTFGVDMDRVIHTPITDAEQLKHDIMTQLKNIDRGDKLCIVIDSMGNLASKKEVEDALDGKSVADMTRAKAFKSLFRMITPHLTMKDIPLIAINHTYKTMEMYSRDVVSGGTGITYSADNIWIIGRQQEKEGKELLGYSFIINVEKSRYVKEKSKIPILVTHQGGLNKWSGLFDVALEGKFLVRGSPGWYQSVDRKTGEVNEDKVRAKDIVDNDEFWTKMFDETDFKDYIKNRYSIGSSIAPFVEDDEDEE